MRKTLSEKKESHKERLEQSGSSIRTELTPQGMSQTESQKIREQVKDVGKINNLWNEKLLVIGGAPLAKA